jgi:hypothetical protein
MSAGASRFVHIFLRSPIDAVSESVVAKLVHAKFIVSTQDQAICGSRSDIVLSQLRTIERLEEQGILHSLGDYRSRGVATITQDAVVLEKARVGLRKPKLSFRSATETSATVVLQYNQFPDPLTYEGEVSYSYFMCWWRSEQEMMRRSQSWKDDQECLDSICQRKRARQAKELEVKTLRRAYQNYKRRQSNGIVDYTLRLTETCRLKLQELLDAGMYQDRTENWKGNKPLSQVALLDERSFKDEAGRSRTAHDLYQELKKPVRATF